MTKTLVSICVLMAAALSLQAQDRVSSMDSATVQVTRAEHAPLVTNLVEAATMGTPGHPYTLIGRHANGEIFYEFHGKNMRTGAGTTWQYNQMAGTTVAVGNYLALTTTAVTPAEADTTLSGELSTLGMARASATVTNSSGALSVPAITSVTPTGTAGSTSYWYWLLACNQGICTTVSAAGTTTTSNATLSASNYNAVVWPVVAGAATYRLARTTSSSAPTGTVSDLVGGSPACDAATCTQLDTSNTLTSVSIPASNLTNFGLYTLVHTWTATGTVTNAQAFGVFNAASSGTLIFEGIFTPVTLNSGDTFQLTESVYF